MRMFLGNVFLVLEDLLRLAIGTPLISMTSSASVFATRFDVFLAMFPFRLPRRLRANESSSAFHLVLLLATNPFQLKRLESLVIRNQVFRRDALIFERLLVLEEEG